MAITPINPLIFREYDVRGLVGRDLHRAAVVLLGKGFATLAEADGVRTVALGRDCRISSPGFRDAIVEGLLSAGLKVIDVGVCPTPLLYFAIHHFGADGGVMITGSHNPPEFNGFKLCVGTGTLYGERIQELRRVIERGVFREGKGEIVSREIIPEYQKFVAGNLAIPRKLKVVVDAGNGTAGAVAPALFREMGMEVTELFCDPDGRFPNHFPDPTVPDNLRFLVEKVRAIGADVGVGYDGDADRIGAVDEKGNVIYGDYLLVLFAREILSRKQGAAIISEVKSSQNLYDDIARHGGRPVMWKAGHSLIKAKMREENAELAGEMSGHVFFRDRYLGFDDAIYASARLFEILAKEGRPLSALLVGPASRRVHPRDPRRLPRRDQVPGGGRGGADRGPAGAGSDRRRWNPGPLRWRVGAGPGLEYPAGPRAAVRGEGRGCRAADPRRNGGRRGAGPCGGPGVSHSP